MTNKCWFSDQQIGAFSAGNHLPLAVQVRGEEVSQRKYTNTDTETETNTSTDTNTNADTNTDMNTNTGKQSLAIGSPCV